MDRLRRNAADTLNLFVLPCLLAMLPWSLGFALLKRLSRVRAWQGEEVGRAWSVARDWLPAADEARFRQRLRLLQLVERVDTWLTVLRSARWWQRRVRQHGDWPQRGQACIVLTYHWGGGLWVWRCLRERGLDTHFVARRPGANDLGCSRVALWYAEFRSRSLRRIGCAGVILTGAATARITAALDDGRSVLGMLDLPAGEHQRTLRKPLLGGDIVLPYGLARLAKSRDVPVLLLSCALDDKDGSRVLRVETLPRGLDADAIVARYVAHLAARLQDEPAHWQLWSAASAMLSASATDASVDGANA